MTRYKMVCWNVNGIRAAAKKGFWEWLDQTQPDILGLQETKISGDQLTPDFIAPPGYKTYWSHAEKRGYSGVAIFSKKEPLSVSEGLGISRFDCEGRVLKADFGDFIFFTIYFPNGQRGEERLQYKMDFYDAFLIEVNKLRDAGKKVVVCGDYNTAHKPIDLARPKENEKVSGFLPIERAWMDKYVTEGYLDTFREFHPDEPDQYSWWNMRSRARERNVGWRIDYFFATPNLKNNLVEAGIRQDVMGSDHCPITLDMDL